MATRLSIAFVILQAFYLSAFSYPQTQTVKVEEDDNSIIFESLTVNDGLSQNNVWCIFQDSRGFMWFGTYDGLNRYDGYEFEIFENDPKDPTTISETYITAISEDKKGNLWVGTQNGLNRLNPYTGEITRFFHDTQNPNSLSSNYVASIFTDRSGAIWIGTRGGGLNKLEIKPENDQHHLFFTHYRHDPDDSTSLSNDVIRTIYEDRSGNMWIGTNNGFNLFDKTIEQFMRFHTRANDSINPFDIDIRANDNDVRAIYEDSKGNLWIGVYNSRLYNFDKEKYTFKKYEGKWVGNFQTIVEDSSGSLWLGSNRYGLLRLNNDRTKSFHYGTQSIGSIQVRSVYVDKSGIIWIGTVSDGIKIVDPARKRFQHYDHNPGNQNSLSYNKIESICEDSFGKVWIATWGKGIDLFDPENGRFINYTTIAGDSRSLSDTLTRPIHEDKEGVIWVGTADGLNKFNRTKQTFTRYYKNPNGKPNPYFLSNDFILCIDEDSKGNLWIGTEKGLNKYNIKNKRFTHYFHDPEDPHSIGSNKIWCLYVDSQGTLWIGTNGLDKYIIDKDHFICYQHNPEDPYSLSTDKIISIYEDHSGMMWIGTFGGGLNRFDRKTGRFFNLTTSDGLPHNTVYGILEDKNGNLWLGTGKGLSRFNPKTLSFRNYDAGDGLQSNEFHSYSYHKGNSGRLYFGGINGLNIFYPDSIKDNKYIPPIVITSFNASGRQISLDPTAREDKKLHLSHFENDLSFEFVALNYTNSGKNQYVYKLEGIDEEWVGSKNRRFTHYVDLPPGDYTFKVKGSNNDGIWNEDGASVRFTILPPWWKTWWVYSIYIALILGTLYALRRYELSRQRFKHNLELKNVEAEKFQELDKMKSLFFANISHEFRTPLTLISGPVQQMLSDEFKGNVKEQYHLILRNTKRLLRLVNQLLDISRLESGKMKLRARPENIVELTRQLTMAFESLASVNDIEFRFVSPEEEIITYLDREHYEKIITNLLSNALKFTPARGEVSVHIPPAPLHEVVDPSKGGIEGGMLEVRITDTGAGIPADHLPHIFDRFYQAGDSYAKDNQGSGIGLALTKELVELHHGEIGVESEVGKGTEFFIRLPLGKDHLREEEIVDETTDVAIEIPPLIRPLTRGERRVKMADTTDRPSADKSAPILLIVEDNPDMRAYIRDMLIESYKVIEAEDGQKGFEKAVEVIPDIIISDVMMPEMDGFQLCERIKSDQRTSHIPVILLTAKDSGESKIEGLETGADDYLEKPFDIRELRARLKNLIDQRRRLRERFSREIYLNPKEITVTSMDERFLQKASEIVEKKISDSEFSVDDFVKEMALSRTDLYRKLKALTGLSAKEFIRTIRLKRAAHLLRHQYGNISEIAYQVGFTNPSYFAECFHKQFKQLPSRYKSKHIDRSLS